MAIASKIFERVGNRLIGIAHEMRMTDYDRIQAKRVIPWFRDQGDKTLRLNYDLTEQSVVFDVGGYMGQWAADIYCKYGCSIFVFEPHPAYAEAIRQKFRNNEKVKVFPFGLSNTNKVLPLNIDNDSSSVYKSGRVAVDVKIQRAQQFLEEADVDVIDLMKVNIEGGEFDLLEHLIESNVIKKITNLQVQFHDFFPDAKQRMNAIQANLTKTHSLTYQYEFVWENWRLK